MKPSFSPPLTVGAGSSESITPSLSVSGLLGSVSPLSTAPFLLTSSSLSVKPSSSVSDFSGSVFVFVLVSPTADIPFSRPSLRPSSSVSVLSGSVRVLYVSSKSVKPSLSVSAFSGFVPNRFSSVSFMPSLSSSNTSLLTVNVMVFVEMASLSSVISSVIS